MILFNCGIYALKRGNNIFYIGSSKRIELRVKQHQQSREDQSITYTVLERCPKIFLNERERFWINKLKSEGVNLENKSNNKDIRIPAKYMNRSSVMPLNSKPFL